MSGVFNRYLSKTLKTLDQASGRSAKSWANKATVLREAEKHGLTALRAGRMAKVEKGRTFQTRVKLGLGGLATVGAGAFGFHTYMQHENNKILARIDKMYEHQ